MTWADDVKVCVAAVGGLGNWLVEMDILLKFLISLVSLLYITKKCSDLYKGKR
jgi:tRNA A37 threonylcarbamoyladenosine dehydratase